MRMVIVVVLALLPAPTSAWELTRDEEGIRAYQQTRPDSKLLAFKAEGVIDAPISRVMTVLLDASRAGEWISRLSESTVRDASRWPEEYLQFTRFDAPWPVTDRIFLSRVRVDVNPSTFQTEVRYFNVDIEEPASDAVRGSAGGSYFILRPLEGGAQTHMVGVSVADPRGSIPGWLVNWVGRNVAYDTMIRLREQVAKGDRPLLPRIRALFEGMTDDDRRSIKFERGGMSLSE